MLGNGQIIDLNEIRVHCLQFFANNIRSFKPSCARIDQSCAHASQAKPKGLSRTRTGEIRSCDHDGHFLEISTQCPIGRVHVEQPLSRVCYISVASTDDGRNITSQLLDGVNHTLIRMTKDNDICVLRGDPQRIIEGFPFCSRRTDQRIGFCDDISSQTEHRCFVAESCAGAGLEKLRAEYFSFK